MDTALALVLLGLLASLIVLWSCVEPPNPSCRHEELPEVGVTCGRAGVVTYEARCYCEVVGYGTACGTKHVEIDGQACALNLGRCEL